MSDFVHPQGICESQSVGAGTRVWAFAHVLSGAVIREDWKICDHAFQLMTVNSLQSLM